MQKNNFEQEKKEDLASVKKIDLNEPISEGIIKNEDRIILVLEDDPNVIKMYKKAFVKYNCKYFGSIKEAEEGLEFLQRNNKEPKILISDFHLPDGESTFFVAKFKSQFPKAKVILCSSDDRAANFVKSDASFEKGKIFEILSKIEEFLEK